MSYDLIPPARPEFSRSDIEEIKRDLDKILTSGRLTLGEYTEKFERQFAILVGVRHAVAVNSGTAALEIVLRAHGLKAGDEVIVPTNTFAATGAAVAFAGGKPVITDVAPVTMTIDSNGIEEAITRRTKGVIAVHIGGLICPDVDAIKETCSRKGLFLIEDAAHAHGSKFESKSAGSLGSAGCFSFYPTKVITTGEGGMITTDNDEIAATARILRDQGKESFNSNRIIRLGYNWRMPELCAALGIVQLRRLPEFIRKRNANARTYDEGLDTMGLEHVATPANQVNNYYKYTFFLPRNIDRDKFKALCRERRVAFGGEVYWPPLHLQPAFREFIGNGRFEMAEEFGTRMANPPMFSEMTREQAEQVLEVVHDVLPKLRS